MILTRSSGALYLLDDGHDSILKEETDSKEDLMLPSDLISKDDNEPSVKSVNLARITELVTKLAEIVREKKYKGRHTDIKRLVGQMEKEIRENPK